MGSATAAIAAISRMFNQSRLFTVAAEFDCARDHGAPIEGRLKAYP
jgi:hypothetical protein